MLTETPSPAGAIACVKRAQNQLLLPSWLLKNVRLLVDTGQQTGLPNYAGVHK